MTYIHNGEVLTSETVAMVLNTATCSTLIMLDRPFPNMKRFLYLLLPGQVAGSARFELDLSNYPEVSWSHHSHGAVTVLVNVTEALTGRTPRQHTAPWAFSIH